MCEEADITASRRAAYSEVKKHESIRKIPQICGISYYVE